MQQLLTKINSTYLNFTVVFKAFFLQNIVDLIFSLGSQYSASKFLQISFATFLIFSFLHDLFALFSKLPFLQWTPAVGFSLGVELFLELFTMRSIHKEKKKPGTRTSCVIQ